jgi:hypothetical protein
MAEIAIPWNCWIISLSEKFQKSFLPSLSLIQLQLNACEHNFLPGPIESNGFEHPVEYQESKVQADEYER